MPPDAMDSSAGAPSEVAGARYLVLKGSGGGGLGDSLRALLAAIAYALATERTLVVDWAHGLLDEAGVDAFPRLFELRDLAHARTLPPGDDVHPAAWRGRIEATMDAVYRADGERPWDRADAIARYSFDMARAEVAEQVVVAWHFDQLPAALVLARARDPSLPSDDEAACHVLWRRHVALAPGVASRVAEADASLGHPRLGVHVRMTKEMALNKGTVSLEQTLGAIRALRRRLRRSHPGARVFLATDNADVVQWLGERIDGLETQPKWFPPPGEAMHLGADCPDRRRATQDALVEMLLLSQSDALVHPRLSSFSRMARRLSGLPDDRVMALSPAGGPWWRRWLRRR